MSGVEFEAWTAALFRKHGYRVKSTAVVGDHGIDLPEMGWTASGCSVQTMVGYRGRTCPARVLRLDAECPRGCRNIRNDKFVFDASARVCSAEANHPLGPEIADRFVSFRQRISSIWVRRVKNVTANGTI